MTDSILRSYQFYSTTTVIPYPAAPFTISSPLDLANLIVWYDATDSVYSGTFPTYTTPAVDGVALGQWRDKSAQVDHMTDAGVYNLLAYETTSLVHSLPAVRSIGGNKGMRTGTTALAFGSVSSFTLWHVGTFDYTNSDTDGRRLTFITSGAPSDIRDNAFSFMRVGATSAVQLTIGHTAPGPSVVSSALTADTPYRICVVCSAGQLTMYVDNVSVSTDTDVATVNLGTGQASLFNQTAASNTELAGDCSEIIMTASAASSGVRDAVDDYLVAKWGF